MKIFLESKFQTSLTWVLGILIYSSPWWYFDFISEKRNKVRHYDKWNCVRTVLIAYIVYEKVAKSTALKTLNKIFYRTGTCTSTHTDTICHLYLPVHLFPSKITYFEVCFRIFLCFPLNSLNPFEREKKVLHDFLCWNLFFTKFVGLYNIYFSFCIANFLHF